METWQNIPSFLGYSISDYGRVRNDKRDHVMVIRRNPHGVCYVALTKGKKQHVRSLPLLVADVFVPTPSQDRDGTFKTPIHLDGDQLNNRADNLMWRPYWFAREYGRQFRTKRRSSKPVIELKTREQYSSPWEAALAFGLLEADIIASILNRTFVWPTFQEFRFVEK